jgi:hypothetical protein
MAQPNSEHIVSAPEVTGNNYQATDDADLGAWCKVYPDSANGGFRYVHDIPDANAGGWQQT